MIVNNVNYIVIKTADLNVPGYDELPLLDIPVMSDDQWNALSHSPEQLKLKEQYLRRKDGE